MYDQKINPFFSFRNDMSLASDLGGYLPRINNPSQIQQTDFDSSIYIPSININDLRRNINRLDSSQLDIDQLDINRLDSSQLDIDQLDSMYQQSQMNSYQQSQMNPYQQSQMNPYQQSQYINTMVPQKQFYIPMENVPEISEINYPTQNILSKEEVKEEVKEETKEETKEQPNTKEETKEQPNTKENTYKILSELLKEGDVSILEDAYLYGIESVKDKINYQSSIKLLEESLELDVLKDIISYPSEDINMETIISDFINYDIMDKEAYYIMLIEFLRDNKLVYDIADSFLEKMPEKERNEAIAQLLQNSNIKNRYQYIKDHPKWRYATDEANRLLGRNEYLAFESLGLYKPSIFDRIPRNMLEDIEKVDLNKLPTNIKSYLEWSLEHDKSNLILEIKSYLRGDDILDEDDWYNLSSNPAMIELLERNLDKVNWIELCKNPKAIDIIRNNLDLLEGSKEWKNLSGNSEAIDILRENPDNIRWDVLSGNPKAIDILKDNLDEVSWDVLSENSEAIDILKDNLDKVDWTRLSSNPKAIDILKDNLDKVDWKRLSGNPAAINILKDNLDKVNWNRLSENPAAIDILKENSDKINWKMLSINSAAIDILRENLDKVDLDYLVQNEGIVEIFREHPELLKRLNISNGWMLTKNSAAIDILEENYHMLDKGILQNKSPKALDLLRKMSFNLDLKNRWMFSEETDISPELFTEKQMKDINEMLRAERMNMNNLNIITTLKILSNISVIPTGNEDLFDKLITLSLNELDKAISVLLDIKNSKHLNGMYDREKLDEVLFKIMYGS